MAITTYSELQDAIANWIDRDDLTDRLPEFIELAEGTLNALLRDPRMVTRTTLALTTPWDRVACPSDMLEDVYAQSTVAPASPLEKVGVDQLVSIRRSTVGGTPRFYAVLGRFIHVAPARTTDGSIDLDYYQAIPALSVSNTTNWLLTFAPDLYLYTACLHAAPLMQDEARVNLFSNLVAQRVSAAVQTGKATTVDALVAQ